MTSIIKVVMVATSIQTVLLLVQSVLAGVVGYLLFLTALAWRAPRSTEGVGDEVRHRFRILVPAHNEARLLPSLLRNLGELDYPRSLYEVHVVADNCRDETAALAREGGAVAHERFDEVRRGKGYALQWLLQRLWEQDAAGDEAVDDVAYVILDADSVVSSNFLPVMDARLRRGERVIQAYYAVRDPGRAWSVSLRYVALAVLHYLRPLGRTLWGGSAGLKGNGMVFAAPVLQGRKWSAALTEDIEFHMALLMDGERVTFAPDAVVRAEMPDTLTGAESQNVRWEQGRLEMARRYVPQLLRRARRAASVRAAFPFVDAAMEHLIPPFSLLVSVSGLALVVSWLWPWRRSRLAGLNRLLSIGVVVGQVVYVLSGLRLARAPRAVYRALLYAPAFLLWKVLLYVRVLVGEGEERWVRTERNRE